LSHSRAKAGDARSCGRPGRWSEYARSSGPGARWLACPLAFVRKLGPPPRELSVGFFNSRGGPRLGAPKWPELSPGLCAAASCRIPSFSGQNVPPAVAAGTARAIRKIANKTLTLPDYPKVPRCRWPSLQKKNKNLPSTFYVAGGMKRALPPRPARPPPRTGLAGFSKRSDYSIEEAGGQSESGAVSHKLRWGVLE